MPVVSRGCVFREHYIGAGFGIGCGHGFGHGYGTRAGTSYGYGYGHVFSYYTTAYFGAGYCDFPTKRGYKEYHACRI